MRRRDDGSSSQWRRSWRDDISAFDCAPLRRKRSRWIWRAASTRSRIADDGSPAAVDVASARLGLPSIVRGLSYSSVRLEGSEAVLSFRLRNPVFVVPD